MPGNSQRTLPGCVEGAKHRYAVLQYPMITLAELNRLGVWQVPLARSSCSRSFRLLHLSIIFITTAKHLLRKTLATFFANLFAARLDDGIMSTLRIHREHFSSDMYLRTMLAHTLAVHSSRRQEERPVKWEYYAQHYHIIVNQVRILARSRTDQHLILPFPEMTSARYPNATTQECARYISNRLEEEHGFFVKLAHDQFFISWDPEFLQQAELAKHQKLLDKVVTPEPSNYKHVWDWIQPVPSSQSPPPPPPPRPPPPSINTHATHIPTQDVLIFEDKVPAKKKAKKLAVMSTVPKAVATKISKSEPTGLDQLEVLSYLITENRASKSHTSKKRASQYI